MEARTCSTICTTRARGITAAEGSERGRWRRCARTRAQRATRRARWWLVLVLVLVLVVVLVVVVVAAGRGGDPACDDRLPAVVKPPDPRRAQFQPALLNRPDIISRHVHGEGEEAALERIHPWTSGGR